MKTTQQKPDFSFEDKYEGHTCGVDEAGRGPLAGPVVSAAVILNRSTLPINLRDAINDSKKISAKKRAWLYEMLPTHAVISIAVCDRNDIDRLNILQATLRAMKQAIETLAVPANTALIDGNKAPDVGITAETIIGGDRKSISIAAASIIAKHHRDMIMAQYAKEFPVYGWERNAGYGTKEHMDALHIHGITPYHRRSFAPVAALLPDKK